MTEVVRGLWTPAGAKLAVFKTVCGLWKSERVPGDLDRADWDLGRGSVADSLHV